MEEDVEEQARKWLQEGIDDAHHRERDLRRSGAPSAPFSLRPHRRLPTYTATRDGCGSELRAARLRAARRWCDW